MDSKDLIVQASEDFNSEPTALPPAAVLGNIFIFMFAGHEASANTLNFIMLLLACHPDVQKLLQADVDRILGLESPNDWSYEEHYSALSTSYVGAVIMEASRLFTVLPFIPKLSPVTPHNLKLADTQYVIPSETLILINTSAIHRHPSYWPLPSEKPLDSAFRVPNPVDSFNPGHWIREDAKDTSNGGFLQPEPGTFIPFSDGSRGCLGKGFALVELVAIVARIFKEYNVELMIDYGPDSSPAERSMKWSKARTEASRELYEGVEFKMSLRLTGKVPVRFVKRAKK